MLRMNGTSRGMPETSAVARLATDAATAQKIADALAESFEHIAVSASEETSGGWTLALHFGVAPDHAAVRAVGAAAGGARAAHCPVVPAHAPVARVQVQPNRIGIDIESALAFGTGNPGTPRGCLLALDGLVKGRR